LDLCGIDLLQRKSRGLLSFTYPALGKETWKYIEDNAKEDTQAGLVCSKGTLLQPRTRM